MLYLLHIHWLLFFGGLALGIVVGWLTYLRAATRWTDRPVHLAIGVVVIGAIVAIADLVPGRYGYWLELGVILAVFYTIGCFIGWALRDLAEFTPAAARPHAAASAAATNSYLFRDAFAGMGAATAYVRTPTAAGGVTCERSTPSPGVLASAPAPGGYTFPKTLPFANATTSRRAEPATGLRRHWSWPKVAGAPTAVAAVPAFIGSKGGYVFPVAATAAAVPSILRAGTNRAGLYKHWTWRGAAVPAARADETPPGDATPFGSAASREAALGFRDTPIAPEPPRTPPPATIVVPDMASSTTMGGGSLPPTSEAPPGPAMSRGMEAAPAIPNAISPRARMLSADRTAPPAVATHGDAMAHDGAISGPSSTSAGGAPPGAGRFGRAGGTTDVLSGEQTSRSRPMDREGPFAAPDTSTAADAAPVGAETRSGAGDGQSAAHLPAATASQSGSQAFDAPVSPRRSATDSDGGQTTEVPPASVAVSSEIPGGADGAADRSSATGGQSTASAAATVPAGAPTQTPPIGSGREGDIATSPGSTLATTTAGLPLMPPSVPGEPATIAAVPGEERHGGERPEGLVTARDNRPDNLKRIRGIGPQNEGRLHGLGIWHFDQIAAWTPNNVRWVGSYLAFPGRIDREKWVEQANLLAGGGDTDFSRRMFAGKVATSIEDGSHGQSNIADVSSLPRKPPR